MAKLTLGNKAEVKSLEVEIGKHTYKVPLTGSLTLAEMKKFRDDEDGFSFFGKYIPMDVLDSLTMDEFKTLSETWKKESAGDSSIPLGE